MGFSEKLYELRKKAGLSQKELAKRLDVAQASINYWEKGQRTPSIDMVSIIADYFGVSLNYLMGFEEDKITQMVASWGVDATMAHSKEEKSILENCKILNPIGQQKVANYAKDLTKIPEYCKDPEAK